MSKIKEKMEEVKANVVDVETKEVTETNETENEEFMTVKLPKAKAHEMLASGEATEVNNQTTEIAVTSEKKEGIISKVKKKAGKVGKVVGAGAAIVAAVAVGVAVGKNKNDNKVTFEDVPQGLPENNNYNAYPTTYETETQNDDVRNDEI